MRYTLMLMLVAIISSVISGIAYTQTAQRAQPVPSKQKSPTSITQFQAQFMAADVNGDGGLSREEAKAAGLTHIVEQFDRLDTNHDGKVSSDELRAALHSRVTS